MKTPVVPCRIGAVMVTLAVPDGSVSRLVYVVPGSPGSQVADDGRGTWIRPASKWAPGWLEKVICTAATPADPEVRISAVPRPTVVRGTCCEVVTKLKSQFRRSELIGIGAAAVAIPAPSPKAEVKPEVVMTAIAVADFPTRLN